MGNTCSTDTSTGITDLWNRSVSVIAGSKFALSLNHMGGLLFLSHRMELVIVKFRFTNEKHNAGYSHPVEGTSMLLCIRLIAGNRRCSGLA